MSIELDWSLVDATLTQSATAFLTNAFDAAPRPDFLGPLSVTTFSFGDTEPQVELLDIRDVQKEFLAVEDGEEDELVVSRPGGLAGLRTATPDAGGLLHGPGVSPSESPDEHFPRRAFPFSPTGSVTGVLPTPQPPSAALFAPGLHSHSINSAAPTPFGPRSRSRSHSPAPPLRTLFLPDPLSLGLAGAGLHMGGGHSRSHSQQTHPHSYAPPSPTPSQLSLPFQPAPSSAPSPSFQLHLRISYTGNLSLGISTSLVINYPSPGFMSLPLELTVTGLAFEGVLIVAFEGGRRRLHLSLVEAPESDRKITPGRRPSGTFSRPSGLGPDAAGMKQAASVGGRILRSAQVESEVGQADKHVLKNVGKVEKFVLEVARKTLENELVFPNFQTVLY
ncbi:mitochondrial inheritance component mdm12 [Rhodotorula toruloides]|uniref:Mitochondrial distribution and morphology protein 12 n=1 Tax=Rhodotorula toruloides TaxID=5286 RepID=A0A511KR08_RHOTO|nr:mitochondrial inheritance component mdm12 [Rhodotorula toruloides]